jgi:DNA-directed RNA polymerase specialized sigma24 family protein
MKKDLHSRDTSDKAKKPGLFAQTDWGVLKRLKEVSRSEQEPLLEVLAKKYWTPIFQYLLIQGYDQFESQDLAQDFFVFALETQLFSKADPERGRFRSFLLGSLNNFLLNQRRKKSAQKRHPEGGFASVEELAEFGYYQPKALINKETPEMIFHRAWLREVVRNVLQSLEQEFRNTGKITHFILFRSRVVAPELDGEQPPPLKDQAHELGLKYMEAANQIITAKRAFLRILEKEVQSYTSSKDASQEKQDVLDLFRMEARA